MSNEFLKAKPVYPNQYLEEMNVTLFFLEDLEVEEDALLCITGNNIYRIFDQGELIGYGPARAGHGYFRVDHIILLKGKHHLVIELLSSHCNSYYTLNTKPFLLAEIRIGDEVISYTGEKGHFLCYENTSRYRKVSRFSYQRTFSESYHFDFDFKDFLQGVYNPYPLLSCTVQEEKSLLPRNVDDVRFFRIHFEKVEEGTFSYHPEIKPYEDRYMVCEGLKIFPKEKWEVNPNDEVSRFVCRLENIETLKAWTFMTYRLPHSYTGFIDIDLECTEDAEVYFVFDEIDASLGKEKPMKIDFFRNTTQNIISYQIKKGLFRHICFEPYTVHYLRFFVRKGEVKVRNLNFVPYESCEASFFSCSFENKKIELIYSAAINTFVQNSVDILTDCPSRERAGWLFDSYFTSMTEYLVSGFNRVEHNTLENYALLNCYPSLPVGMIPMCYPGEFPDGTFIPNWSLWYILELREYLRRNHDASLIEASEAKIIGLLSYFRKFENELGLLEDLKGWVFLEWSKANDDEFIKGVNFPSNMLYAASLEAAGELLSDQRLIEKSKRLKEMIREKAFDGEFFNDNMIRKDRKFVLTGNRTETCQYYAFYFGIAEKGRYPDLFETMLTKFGPERDCEHVYPDVYKSNVLIGDYLRLFILLREGYLSEVQKETVSYFYRMAELTGTLWEHDSVFASLNHGLTSCISVILTEAIFGLHEIDQKNHIILLNQEHLSEVGSIKIPLQGGILVLENDGTKIIVNAPDCYFIKYR